MGIYTDAEIRYGVILSEEYVEEREGVDGGPNDELERYLDSRPEEPVELISLGDYERVEGPKWAVVYKDAPKVRAGENVAVPFKPQDLTVLPGSALDHAALTLRLGTFGIDWREASLFLYWSRG